jgi:tetratricopeptide (TPR) repeat protein
MGPSLTSEKTIREYLLGQVSDETTLEEIEELLFTDEEFCSQAALAEDGLINDYVLGRLDEADAERFRATLKTNPDRRFQFELTQALREKALARPAASAARPSFFSSLASLFRQPMYAGAFAVLLIAAVIAVVYFSSRNNQDQLAELRSLYREARPTETRIAEFEYAPLSQLRGAPNPVAQGRLRRIENNLIDAADKNSNAQTHHALGVFQLTQQKYPEAISELQAAAKLAGTNAKYHNDLGSAYYELANTSQAEKQRFEYLDHALDEFTQATELDANLLEALFNRSLALQELGLRREAKESWTRYLQKDGSSPWASEARKKLAGLENEQTLFKKGEDVLRDFLAAYRNQDRARALKIHNETKGLLKTVMVPWQLSQRYLVATTSGNQTEARESLAAMAFIGDFERTQNSEFFFLS